MCGIVGIQGTTPVNQALYDALTVLQHRGQDAAGIVTIAGETLRQRKANGLVREVFEERHMQRLIGNVGIGHVRYPTPVVAVWRKRSHFMSTPPLALPWHTMAT